MMMCFGRRWLSCTTKLARGFITSRSRTSKEAPTFSTAGDPKTCNKQMRNSHMCNLLFFGKPNIRPVPQYESIDEFGEQALEVLEVVTKHVAEGDFACLDGLVTQDCISNLKGLKLHDLSESKKKVLAVNKNDIFLHMVAKSNFMFSKVLFVTFSFPQLEKCKLLQKEIDRNKQELAKHHTKKLIQKLLGRNEVVVGSYMFIYNRRDELAISKISQFNTVDLWSDYEKKFWLMCLDYHVKTGQPVSTSLCNIQKNIINHKIGIKLF